MAGAASVLVCALSLLGRTQNSPPITLVDTRPADVSATAEAFVRHDPDMIFLVTSTRTFVKALAGGPGCRRSDSMKKIASIIVHEEWHLKHGADEQGAYQAQLTMLHALGSGPGTPLYGSVTKAMLTVRALQRRLGRPEMVAARASEPDAP